MATPTESAPPEINAADFLRLDALLDDDEKRSGTPSGPTCADRIRADVAEWFESGNLPARELAKGSGPRPPRDAPARLRLRGHERDRVRPRVPGARSR